MQAQINRLTFESVIDGDSFTATHAKSATENKKEDLAPFAGLAVQNALAEAQTKLAALQPQIENPQSELDRLTRQFWVTKEQVKANKYDLSASRYRQVDADAAYHEKPSVTLERMSRLEHAILVEIKELKNLIERSSS